MRHVRIALALAVSAAILSCSTVAPFGRVDHVSAADMEAAVTAFKAATRADAEIDVIEVVGRNEIVIYQASERRNYTSMIRVKGKWHVGEVVIRHSVY
jgi:hypothetical protein